MSRLKIYDLGFKNGIFLLILTTCFLLPTSASAASSAELNRQIEQLRRDGEVLLVEQQKLQAELEKVNAQSQSLGTAVKSLDTTRKKLAADIKVTQSKINSTTLNIKSLENNMADKERQIETHYSAIGLALQALSDYDSQSLLMNVLASGKLSDLWQDKGRLEDLNVRLGEEVDNLRETKAVLSEEKKKKEADKNKILGLQAELSGQKKVVEESQKAKEKLLAETKSKEAAYQQMLADNMALQRQSEQDLSNLEEQLRITLDPSLFPSPSHGILSWPIDNVYITGKFGRSDCRIYPPPDCFHNGTDFRASVGTPVRAMASGVVAGSDNTDRQKGCYSYGNWILLKYDNGLSSVYAHLSASLVKNGQRVEKGQVVALSGGAFRAYGSGLSTGPHLHIGLFPSQGVEAGLFTTSKGCKQVYVPLAKGRDAYLDPLAYLPSL